MASKSLMIDIDLCADTSGRSDSRDTSIFSSSEARFRIVAVFSSTCFDEAHILMNKKIPLGQTGL